MQKKKFTYGTVIKLTREDTLADIERNFKRMKENGLDTVVVWPAFFWWEEKKKGYPYNTGRALLKIAEQVGLNVIMELAGQLTAMEYAPDFLMKDEYYCRDEHGHRRLSVSCYGWLNYFHPEVNEIVCSYFRGAAEAYKDYPALAAFDVFNETAFCSYDEYTIAEFRLWLERKYTTIERLNEVWERTYESFSQVDFAPWMWMSIMPVADFGAFRREAVGIIISRWCDAIREVDTKHPFIADNIGSMVTNGTGMYNRPQDEFVLKEVVDDIGMSFYPKQVKGTQPIHARWCACDSFYAASRREGFYIAEMQTHIQAMFNPTTAVRRHELKHWCYESLAAGAKGLIYWMWRPFTKGLQTAGRGLVDYLERSTPRLEFAKEFSELVGEVGTLTPSRGKVGILFDRQCEDFQVYYTNNYSIDQNIYPASVVGAYKAMHDIGINPDIIEAHELKNYKLVILSNQIVVGKALAAALNEFVREGGILVLDGKVGVVDEFSMLNPILPGGDLNSTLGNSYTDTDYEELDFTLDGKKIRGFWGREITELTGGKALATFNDGTPAVIESSLGQGRAITVNTNIFFGYGKDSADADLFARWLDERFDLRTISVTAPLKARVADGDGERYAFVFNYTNEAVTGHLFGEGFDTDVIVGANDVIVVKCK